MLEDPNSLVVAASTLKNPLREHGQKRKKVRPGDQRATGRKKQPPSPVTPATWHKLAKQGKN